MIVSVPCPVYVPDGWEPVEIRVPIPGDHYVCVSAAEQCVDYCTHTMSYQRCIVRKCFVWPKDIKVGTWAYRNNSGRWFLSEEKPNWCVTSQGWYTTCGGFVVDLVLDYKFPDVDIKMSRMQKLK